MADTAREVAAQDDAARADGGDASPKRASSRDGSPERERRSPAWGEEGGEGGKGDERQEQGEYGSGQQGAGEDEARGEDGQADGGVAGEARGSSNQTSIRNRNIWVGNLSFRATNEDVLALFSKYAQVESVKLMRDPRSGESRGFGFVVFTTEEEANKALDATRGETILGQVVRCEKARRSRSRTPTPGQFAGVRGPHERRYIPPRSEPRSSRGRDDDDRAPRSDPRGGPPRDDRYSDRRGDYRGDGGRYYEGRGGYDPRGYDRGYEPRGYDPRFDDRRDDRGHYYDRPPYDDRRGYEDRGGHYRDRSPPRRDMGPPSGYRDPGPYKGGYGDRYPPRDEPRYDDRRAPPPDAYRRPPPPRDARYDSYRR